jgi:isopentenyl phosphate kinase
MTVVLKLGGSVITEKDRRETLDGEALDAAADAIADAAIDRLVVVHGAGSFGHHYADEHDTTVTEGTHDAGAAMDIHGAMTTLNRFVLSRLHGRDVPALPVHPLSAAARDADGDLTLPLSQVATMLDEGFVPVLHGDVVAHAGEGVTILSGDEVVQRLATDLAVDRVGLCSTVPGVYDEAGDVLSEITSFADVADALGGSDATDVTGGMAGKVRTLLDLSTPAHIFGPADLDAFLRGESPGTRIERA